MGDSIDEIGQLLDLVESAWKVRALSAEDALAAAERQIDDLKAQVLKLFRDLKNVQRQITDAQRPSEHDDGWTTRLIMERSMEDRTKYIGRRLGGSIF